MAPPLSAYAEGSLSLHTLSPVSPSQGNRLSGTVGAWLQGENDHHKEQNSEKIPIAHLQLLSSDISLVKKDCRKRPRSQTEGPKDAL